LPCLPLEAGALAVTGTGVPNGATALRPWVSLGVGGRLEIELSTAFVIEAQGGVAAPLVRDTFYFLPGSDVFHPAALAEWAGLGVGAQFL
jgi:hypothetical protein